MPRSLMNTEAKIPDSILAIEANHVYKKHVYTTTQWGVSSVCKAGQHSKINEQTTSHQEAEEENPLDLINRCRESIPHAFMIKTQ